MTSVSNPRQSFLYKESADPFLVLSPAKPPQNAMDITFDSNVMGSKQPLKDTKETSSTILNDYEYSPEFVNKKLSSPVRSIDSNVDMVSILPEKPASTLLPLNILPPSNPKPKTTTPRRAETNAMK